MPSLPSVSISTIFLVLDALDSLQGTEVFGFSWANLRFTLFNVQ